MPTEFKYIDRGKMYLAVLLPGWATDFHIFDSLDLEFNYLVPQVIDPDDFEEELNKNLKWNKPVLIGWSLGAVLGLEYMLEHPEDIKHALILSIDTEYDGEMIEKMKNAIKNDKQGYLKVFYRKCLDGSSEEWKKWFRETLLERYLAEMKEDHLLKQLNYLERVKVDVGKLKAFQDKVLFMHGKEDRIVSFNKVNGKLGDNIGQQCFKAIKGAGHMCFFSQEFKEYANKLCENGKM